MPTITTRGNITATAYGFGKVGGGVLGSYYLVTIANSGGTYGGLNSMTKVSLSGLAFSESDTNQSVSYYGVLSNTGTLNWCKSLNYSESTSGVIGYDDVSKIYMYGRAQITSGYFNESNGTWTDIGKTTGTTLKYNTITATIKPVGSYIYVADGAYDSSFTYFGFGGVFQPIAGGSGDCRMSTSSTYPGWYVYSSQVTKASSSTAYGIVGGRAGDNAIGPLFTTISYSAGSTPVILQTRYIQNSNAGYISSNDSIIASVMDSSGNAYVMAVFQYDQFGNYGSNRTIYKVNSSGTVLWARKLLGGASYPSGSAILDTLGNVYFAINNGSGIAITKYTTSGTFVWDRTLNLGTTFDNRVQIDTDNASFWAGATVYQGKSVIIRAPADGTKTGTYGGYAYSVGQTSDSAYTGYATGTLGSTSYLSYSTTSNTLTASSYSPTIVKTTI